MFDFQGMEFLRIQEGKRCGGWEGKKVRTRYVKITGVQTRHLATKSQSPKLVSKFLLDAGLFESLFVAFRKEITAAV